MGGFRQTGVLVITRSEANDILSAWLSDGTPLRLDFATPDVSLSVTGTLAPSVDGMLCVGLGNIGFIEIHLAESWQFDYFAPDAMRTHAEARIGLDYDGSPQQTGAGLILATPKDVQFLLLEIVK
jgi:hypothetical protein